MVEALEKKLPQFHCEYQAHGEDGSGTVSISTPLNDFSPHAIIGACQSERLKILTKLLSA
jgi:hypothetical protein